MPGPRPLIALAAVAALLIGFAHRTPDPARAQAGATTTTTTTTTTTPAPPPSKGCLASGNEVRTHAATNQKVVALTFDDGPSDYTPAILRILGANGVPATFFEIGMNQAGHEALMRQIIAAGDEIGDHTWHHIDLPPLSSANVRGELARTKSNIKRITGFTTCMFRPPHGLLSGKVNTIARKLGLVAVLWSVDTKDFTMPGTDAIYQSAVDGARPGAIILMHEGGGNRSETVAALPRVIATLKQRGYTFVTASQLLGLKPLSR